MLNNIMIGSIELISNISDFSFSNIITHIIDSISKNDFFEGGLYLGILGSIGFMLKPIPRYIWDRIVRQLVYTTTIEEKSELYKALSKWMIINHPNKMRNVEAVMESEIEESDDNNNNNISCYDKKIEKNNNIFFSHHNDHIFIIKNYKRITITKEREKLEHAESFRKAYMGRIHLSGFLAKKSINNILEESKKYLPSVNNQLYIKNYSYQGYWDYKYEKITKDVDKFFFKQKKEILKTIDEFINKKGQYENFGWDYKLNLLFYGEGGLGKTSFTKALAKYTNRDFYHINLSTMSDSTLQSAYSNINSNAIVLFDDIDIGLGNRESKKGEHPVSLSTLFSIFQGTLTRPNVVNILTTNLIDKLDKTLIRDGRIDYKFLFKKPTKNDIEEYLNLIYNTTVILKNEHYNVTIPKIESYCKKYNNLKQVVEVLDNEHLASKEK